MPSGLQRIVDHCLEKEPDRRFQTARDLSFALGGVKKAEKQAVCIRGRKPPSEKAPRDHRRLHKSFECN